MHREVSYAPFSGSASIGKIEELILIEAGYYLLGEGVLVTSISGQRSASIRRHSVLTHRITKNDWTIA